MRNDAGKRIPKWQGVVQLMSGEVQGVWVLECVHNLVLLPCDRVCNWVCYRVVPEDGQFDLENLGSCFDSGSDDLVGIDSTVATPEACPGLLEEAIKSLIERCCCVGNIQDHARPLGLCRSFFSATIRAPFKVNCIERQYCTVFFIPLTAPVRLSVKCTCRTLSHLHVCHL
jgi:hypothetical protein